jgi:hypothetical protein
MCEVLGKEFLLTIPHRDDCFCWSKTQSISRQHQHAKNALAAFIEEEYRLTPDILQFSGGKFTLYQNQTPDQSIW